MATLRCGVVIQVRYTDLSFATKSLTLIVIDLSLNMDAREELYRIMVSSLRPDPVSEKCWRWYLSFLDSQIKEIWSMHLGPVIRDLPFVWNAAKPEDWDRIYKVICVIASTIAKGMQGGQGVEISLDNIIEELTIADLLASPTVTDHVRQTVWSLAGPITMLFDPKSSNANFSLLQLRRPASTHTARGRHRGTVITSFAQPVSIAQEPFYQMLMQFGTLLPEVRQSGLSGQCFHVLNSTNDSHFYPNYVSFDVLKNVAKLKIEWVNTLNLHLQLDERKRILRLYRFPAFCRLLYADGSNGGEPNGKTSFLCQLFNHYKASRMQGQPQERDSLTIFDFSRDMILSYRLLFGMDRKSRKIFRAESENWQHDSLHDGPFSGQKMYEIDPLLWTLCTDSGESPELKKLLNLLDGEETSPRYAFEDFPFLGGRLLQLQTFIEGHKATTWSLLWHNRTDARNWWVVWTAGAVLLIGGGTIVLQFWQLVFQAMSVWYQPGRG